MLKKSVLLAKEWEHSPGGNQLGRTAALRGTRGGRQEARRHRELPPLSSSSISVSTMSPSVRAFSATMPCLGYSFIEHLRAHDVPGSEKSRNGGELKGSEDRNQRGSGLGGPGLDDKALETSGSKYINVLLLLNSLKLFNYFLFFFYRPLIIPGTENKWLHGKLAIIPWMRE